MQPETVKPGAVPLPRLAEGNVRTTPVQVVSTVTLPVAKTVAAPRSGQKPPAPHPLFTAAREVKPVAAVSTVSPVVPPRPLRTREQTAALPWVATVSRALVCPSTTNANKLSSTYHSPRGVVFSAHFA